MPIRSLPICQVDAPQAAEVDRSRAYLSCRWLEEGLAFNRRSLHACLIVHHGRGFPKLCDFNGGEIPMERVRAARADIIRQNQNGGHADCKGCPHLVRRRWPQPKHLVRLIGIAQFTRCNLYCNYCYLQTQDPASFADGFHPYEVMPAIEGLIRDTALAPDATFDWGGGEPTIYREFDAILALATRRGGTTWIHTNGTRFPKPLTLGLATKRVHVICSVDAGFAETFARMKQRDLLERVWTNLQQYIGAGCDVYLKYIVKDENASEAELKAFCGRARQIGARQLIVDIDYDFPRPSPAVVMGLACLMEMGPAHGMYTTFGATGALFTPEIDVARRLREQADAPTVADCVRRRLRQARLAAERIARIIHRRLRIA